MEMEIRDLEKNKAWDYENGFYWFSSPSRMGKMLTHFELYKMILDLPGSIFELGVYKGASLIRLATFRSLLENDLSRKIVGFDAFGTFPRENLALDDDIKFIDRFEGSGGDGLNELEVEQILSSKNFENFELIKGNVLETLPQYLERNSECRISFLHLDMDVKEPTDFALDQLYDYVVPGGLIVFDDYSAVAGATISADRFAKKHGLKIEKLPYYCVPAFIRKPL